MAQYTSAAEPRPIIPALGRYYAFTSDLAYLVVRVSVGLLLLPHGWAKINTGPAGIMAYMSRLGLEPSALFTSVAFFNEIIGAILIALGLFTRPAAALLVIQFIVLTVLVHIPRGYMVAGGVEFPLLWLLMLIAVLLRGGGPWSLDRKLGREI
jgi:putative oxidoreductase